MNEAEKKAMGQRLKEQRKKFHLTREEFAEQLEISPQFLAEIENGTKGVSTNTLYKLGEFCSIDYLLFGKDVDKTSDIFHLLNQLPTQYTTIVCNLIVSLSQIDQA